MTPPLARSNVFLPPNSSIVLPKWDGAIPKGYYVCDTSSNALTERVCALHEGTTQVHDNVTMCLLRLSTVGSWYIWLGETRDKYNITVDKDLAPFCSSATPRARVAGMLGLLLLSVAVLSAA